jgi:hypothetical protein
MSGMNFGGGFTGDEDDATRVALQHGGAVVPGQANPTQEIDLEIVEPILVGELADSEIGVDTYVGSDQRQAGPESCCEGSRTVPDRGVRGLRLYAFRG